MVNARLIWIFPRGVDRDPGRQNGFGIPQIGRTGSIIEMNIHVMNFHVMNIHMMNIHVVICRILEVGLVALKGAATASTGEIGRILGRGGRKKTMQYFVISLAKISCQIVISLAKISCQIIGAATKITQVTGTEHGIETENGITMITHTKQPTQ